MKRGGASIKALLLATLLSLAACRSYQLEPAREARLIRVAPILNETDLPQLIGPLSRQLREAIAHDPQWSLASSRTDAPTLRIRLLADKRRVISRDPNDTGRPLSLRQSITAELAWEDVAASDSAKAPLRVEVEGVFYAQPGLIASQDGLVAELANRLAREILLAIEPDRQSLAP